MFRSAKESEVSYSSKITTHMYCIVTTFRCLNKQEQILESLTTGLDAPLEVRVGGVAGRGVFATGAIAKGTWLCEYKAALTYPPSEKPNHLEEYDLNNEGSYVVETSYAIPGVGKLCWDATRRYHQIGRYLNHAQRPNTELTAPVFARGKWRIGYMAVRDIEVGDEVVWDYQVRGEVWSGCRLVGGTVEVGDGVVWDYQVRGEVWSGCRLVGGTVEMPSDGGSGRFALLYNAIVFTNPHSFYCDIWG